MMKTTAAVSLLIASLLAGVPSNAGDPVRLGPAAGTAAPSVDLRMTDLPAQLQKLCDRASQLQQPANPGKLQASDLAKLQRTSQALCAKSWAPLVQQVHGRSGLPPSVVNVYVGSGFDLCKTLHDLDVTAMLDPAIEIENACQTGQARALGSGIGGGALNLVQGLGDFLVERAQEEMVEYALGQLQADVCHDSSPNALSWHEIFARTCQVAFTFEAATSGRLRDALLADLRRLPALLVERIPVGLEGDLRSAWIAILDDTAQALGELLSGEQPIRLFTNIRELVLRDQRMKVTCDVSASRTQGLSLPCRALVGIEVGAQAADEFSTSSMPDVGHWIESAAIKFCHDYGPGNGASATTCLIDANYVTSWHDRLASLASAMTPLAQTQVWIRQAMNAGALPSEATSRGLPDIVKAVRGSMSSYAQTCFAGVVSDSEEQALVTGFNVGIVVLSSDWKELEGSVREFLSLDAVKGRVPSGMTNGALFLLDLSQAKSRDDVKEVISDAAAPLGSYKVKYGRARGWTVAINGFVGAFAGAQAMYATKNGTNSSESVFRLQAPVGLDLEPSSLSGRLVHAGLAVVVVDPLALTMISGNGNTAQPEWASVLTPGAYARIGLFGSPVVLMTGFTYQPGLRSSDSCGNQACWTGAMQYGASLSADVPILLLH